MLGAVGLAGAYAAARSASVSPPVGTALLLQVLEVLQCQDALNVARCFLVDMFVRPHLMGLPNVLCGQLAHVLIWSCGVSCASFRGGV